jgi:hypothetical protein
MEFLFKLEVSAIKALDLFELAPQHSWFISVMDADDIADAVLFVSALELFHDAALTADLAALDLARI